MELTRTHRAGRRISLGRRVWRNPKRSRLYRGSATTAEGHFALGFGGNGITYRVIAAEILRDRLLGLGNPDAQLFRFGR